MVISNLICYVVSTNRQEFHNWENILKNNTHLKHIHPAGAVDPDNVNKIDLYSPVTLVGLLNNKKALTEYYSHYNLWKHILEKRVSGKHEQIGKCNQYDSILRDRLSTDDDKTVYDDGEDDQSDEQVVTVESERSNTGEGKETKERNENGNGEEEETKETYLIINGELIPTESLIQFVNSQIHVDGEALLWMGPSSYVTTLEGIEKMENVTRRKGITFSLDKTISLWDRKDELQVSRIAVLQKSENKIMESRMKLEFPELLAYVNKDGRYDEWFVPVMEIGETKFNKFVLLLVLVSLLLGMFHIQQDVFYRGLAVIFLLDVLEGNISYVTSVLLVVKIANIIGEMMF